MSNILIFGAVSGFCIWFIATQKIFDYIFFTDFLKEMRKCQICLGFWVCLIFAWVFNVNLVPGNIIALIATAAISSVLIYLIRRGWTADFGVTYIK